MRPAIVPPISPAWSLSDDSKSGRDNRSAGQSPKAIVASEQKIIVPKSTVVSGVRSSARKIGNTVAIDDTSNCAAHVAVNNPSAPPASDSIKPCTSSWRTILDRVPPMARRIAISFCRADPNANIMFARFMHDVSSTVAASPCRIPIGSQTCVFCGRVLMSRRSIVPTTRSWFLLSSG